ncbi:MAG: FAD-binding domain-containing protein [Chloroflexia bacterium]
MIQLVWYRRDLRLADHAPLVRAARRGPVLPLFVAEPDLARRPDFGARHWTFARDSLRELRAALAALGQPLIVRTGSIATVLAALHEVAPISAIWTHATTGRAPVSACTDAARDWAASRGIQYHELAQDGVVRAGPRGRWASGWASRLAGSPLPAPEALTPISGVAPGAIPTHQALGLAPDDRPVPTPGGTPAGLALLDAFLAAHDSGYPAVLDDPLRAAAAATHLGPHLAWGTLSPRQVIAACGKDNSEEPAAAGRSRSSRRVEESPRAALIARLRARDRAIQRLHDPASQIPAHIRRWTNCSRPTCPSARRSACRPNRGMARGRDGLPPGDAAMRQLRATGWLPHPLRALVVAFAAHALWLPWQRLDPFLAKQWLDYEPGIHLDQLQHHAGIGPAAPPPLPDPVAQGQAHDPTGAYVRRWLPALRAIPDDYLHQPWLLPADEQERTGCLIGTHYPVPIVDHEAIARAARAALAETRRRPAVAAALAAARASADNPPAKAQQMTLF